MNTYVSNNFTYVMSGWTPSLVVRNNGANYTTTSTSFTDVDSTNLICTLTLSGTKAFVWALFHTQAAATGDGSEFDIIANGTTRLGHATHGLVRLGQSVVSMISIFAMATGLSTGSNTFKLQYRCITSGTTTILANAGAATTTSGSLVNLMAWGL